MCFLDQLVAKVILQNRPLAEVTIRSIMGPVPPARPLCKSPPAVKRRNVVYLSFPSTSRGNPWNVDHIPGKATRQSECIPVSSGMHQGPRLRSGGGPLERATAHHLSTPPASPGSPQISPTLGPLVAPRVSRIVTHSGNPPARRKRAMMQRSLIVRVTLALKQTEGFAPGCGVPTEQEQRLSGGCAPFVRS